MGISIISGCAAVSKRILFRLVVAILIPLTAHTARMREKTLDQVYQQIRDKGQAQIPGSTPPKVTVTSTDLHSVKPINSNYLYRQENDNEAELERLTDEQIRKLYQLSQQYRTSPQRGEIWLRMGELYSEKARRLDFKAQREYDQKLADFEGGKLPSRPKLVRRGVEENNRKAVQLYQWFTKEFKNDEKMDQALFFLGYNYMLLGEESKAVKAYTELSRNYPKSAYVYEAHFALAEYYFEKEKWKQALDAYNQIIAKKSSRLYDFAMFKAAWCYHGMGKNTDGIRLLEQVILRGDARSQAAKLEGRAEINTIRLASEARRDLVIFYAETGEYKKAESYFQKWLGDDEKVFQALELLAYRYATGGHREATRTLFQRLIDLKSNSEKAFDYKYQIVQSYHNIGLDKKYLVEIRDWVEHYGPRSSWYQAHKKDTRVIETANTLPETILRNYALARHQNAQNTRSTKPQGEAADAYRLYAELFPKSPKISEMHFFFGELLYDMGKFAEAAAQYNWVVDNDPRSPYVEKSIVNSLLALEKALPTDKKIREGLGESTEEQPLGSESAKFISAAEKYLKRYPNGERNLEVRFRIARLLAVHNHFEPAIARCREIIKIAPGTPTSDSSADLMLDIYEAKKDYGGLTNACHELISNPKMASTKIIQEARKLIEKSAYKAAVEMDKENDHKGSAKAFEAFASTNPKSDLAANAFYNAAIGYERAGDAVQAEKMHLKVIEHAGTKNGKLKSESIRILGNMNRQKGSLREAAKYYEMLAKDFPKEKESANSAYNAAVIWAGFNEMTQAEKAYELHYQIADASTRLNTSFEWGELLRKKDNRSGAAKAYERYLSLNPKEGWQVVAANFYAADMEDATGALPKTQARFRKSVDVYKKLSGEDAEKAVSTAAQAKWKLALVNLTELKKEKFPADSARQKVLLQAKLKTMNKLNGELADIIKMNNGPMIVAALVTTGQANEYMANAIAQAPAPRGMKPEEMAEYNKAIAGITEPFQRQALEAYRTAWSRAVQTESYSEHSDEARKALLRISPQDAKAGGMTLPSRSVDWMGL